MIINAVICWQQEQQHNDIILKKEHDTPDEKLEFLVSLYFDGPFNTFS